MQDFALLGLFIVIGLIAGIIMSLVGASAVMIIVPVLNLVVGYTMTTSIGISLFVDVIASLFIGYAYWKNGKVDLGNAMSLSVGAILGAQVGAVGSVSIPDWFMAISYAVWMLTAGYSIWSKGLTRQGAAGFYSKFLNQETGLRQIIVSLILGIIIGINSGLFGAGGGALIMMVLIFVMDYPIQMAIGTSTIIMALTAFSAVFTYWQAGNVNLYAGLIISVGTVFSGITGVSLASRAGDELLAKIVGGLFMGLGVVLTLLRFI
jgi:uncharacterized membrane protein YfcA